MSSIWMALKLTLLLTPSLVSSLALSATPADVLNRSITAYLNYPDRSSWLGFAIQDYGPAIAQSAVYEAAAILNMPSWATNLDDALEAFSSTVNTAAYNVSHNISCPWTNEIGDSLGLMPISYLSRAEYHNETCCSGLNWYIADKVAQLYVYKWPLRLPDGTFSRHEGWPDQPDQNASFLWSDDQFMGTALLARLAAKPGFPAGTSRSYLDLIAHQQVSFAQHMQVPAAAAGGGATAGLFFHGYNYATHDTSCCFWGRANGWVMMSHAEIVGSLSLVWPDHPLLPALLDIWRSQAEALRSFQSPGDGRWHQVVNDTSTFLETSVTSMTLYSLIKGVLGGWLDAATFSPTIEAAWTGLLPQIQDDGTVTGICAGTGIEPNATAYEARPTAYNQSIPGLGSVFRAALAYQEYTLRKL